jgi:parallel beta-helix repeat protein
LNATRLRTNRNNQIQAQRNDYAIYMDQMGSQTVDFNSAMGLDLSGNNVAICTIQGKARFRNYRATSANTWGYYAWSSEVDIENCEWQNSGLLIGEPAKLNLKRTKVTKAPSWGINGWWTATSANPSAVIEDCTIQQNAGGGAYLYGKTAGQIQVRNTNISNNGGHGLLNYFAPTVVENCECSGNANYGLYFENIAQGTVANCVVSNNRSHGVVGVHSTLTATGVTANGNAAHGFHSWEDGTGTSQWTLQNCRANSNQAWGAALYRTTVRLSNCESSLNAQGGFYDFAGTNVLEDCNLNQNLQHGYWSQQGTGTLRRCTMQGNAVWGHVAYEAIENRMENCVVAKNGFGSYHFVQGPGSQIWNSTIADNGTTYGVYQHQGNLTLKNTIISRNGFYGLVRSSGVIDHSHNLVFGHAQNYYQETPHATEIRKPPRFLNAALGDYRLAKGSPAINTGMDASAHAIAAQDKGGRSRGSFRAWEIGAFEYDNPDGSLRVMKWGERK